jgi:hypothetical protein
MNDFGHAEGVLLAHAMVDRVAADVGVRVIFIKGPGAVAQGLRPVRTSLDADVLVDPGQRPVLARRLSELGWIDEHPYTSPTILPPHSWEYRNPRWPCELDVHDRFPGFFAEPQSVFERLWERRTQVTLAARPIPVPTAEDHALLLALNCLRDPHQPAKVRELEFLVSWTRAEVVADKLVYIAQRAAELGAADTAAPYLDAVQAPEIARGTWSDAQRHDWLLVTQPVDSTAVSWLEELRRLPARSWPRYLWYAVWLSDVELRLAEPSLPPGRRALMRARVRRLRRGVRALPAAFRNVRSFSRD